MARPGSSILEPARAAGRTLLTPAESLALLSAYDIPVAGEALLGPDEPLQPALDRLRFPLVVKVDSPDIAHKTEVGGVVVGCRDLDDVQRARRQVLDSAASLRPDARLQGVLVQELIEDAVECFLGLQHDEQFGPVVAFGLGGIWIEVLDDAALRLPPFDESIALQMIDETRAGRILRGVRGRPPADLAAVARALVALGRLAHDWRGVIRELDVNPLMALSRGVVAVDALVVLGEP